MPTFIARMNLSRVDVYQESFDPIQWGSLRALGR